MSGSIQAIWIKRSKRGPMDPVDAANLIEGRGIEGNANQGGRRQVTLIDEAVWQTMMASLQADVDPSARRANLMLRGVDLRESRGRVLVCGETQIRIFGETHPCERMDEALAGLREVMRGDWRGGAYGEVICSGTIRVGDAIAFDDSLSVDRATLMKTQTPMRGAAK